MNVHFSYRLHKIPAVEKDIQHQIERLQKRLQLFRPELIHLKGVVEEVSAREGTSVSLNLRLPSGQMAVQVSAPTAAAAVKGGFEDLLQQVNKHKEILRACGALAQQIEAELFHKEGIRVEVDQRDADRPGTLLDQLRF